jgi:outer membrane receptor for ferrienterochelin and colicin
MRKKMRKIFYFIITSLFVSSTFAQVSIEVNVSSQLTGAPVTGIIVHIQNDDIGFEADKTTNEKGKVTFSDLTVAGKYRVLIDESEIYYGANSDQIILTSNSKNSVNLKIAEKKTYSLDEVTVQSATTKINSVNAEVSSNLTAKELEKLPVEGRDITRSLFRLPNVVQATGFYPEAPNVSINGANSLFTNYLIDGLDNNENFLGGQKFAVPVGFTQNINVLTNNYTTEFGITGNGIVNITSKSGSNITTGEVFYSVRPGPSIDGSSPFAQRDLSGNQVKDGFQRHQFGFGLGGAVIPDQTFYYINAEQTFDKKDNLLSVPQLGINETVPGNNNFTYLSGKIDHKWSNHFKSSLRVNAGIVDIERQGGGLEGGVTFPSAGNTQDRNSLLIASKNYYIADGWSSETNFQYSRFRWNYANPVNPNSPQVTVLNPSEQTIAVLGNPGFVFDALENTIQAEQKFNFYLDDHILKFGFGLLSSDHSLFGGGNVNGNYTVKLNQEQLDGLRNSNLGSTLNINDIPSDVEVLNYAVELQPKSFGARHNIFSTYVEDQFSLSNRLNFTLGLRYDYDDLSKGGSDEGDYNNLSPRFSVNYRLDERNSLRAGYGIFYEKILYAIYSDALQQNTTSPDYIDQLQALIDKGILPSNTDISKVTFNGNFTTNLSNVSYLNGPNGGSLSGDLRNAFSNERRILNPNGYDNPYTHQFSLGYQYQIDNDKLFYVDLMHTRSYNLYRLRDLNAPAPYPLNDPNNVTVRTQAEADLTRPIPIYSDAQGNFAILNGDTLRGISRSIVVSETEGESRYYAMSLNFQKDKGFDNYSFRLIYTLSYLENNTEDINFKAMDANNFVNEWGPSINDRTHVINFILNYYPIDDLTLTMATLLQSGQPINRIPDAEIYGTTDLNGDGRSFGDAYVGNSDRFPGESRNNDRLPWSNTFDFSMQYNLRLTNIGTLELRADVFNIFNTENLSGYSNNATQSNQIQVGSKSSGLLVRRNASAPRQFQFGLRYLL